LSSMLILMSREAVRKLCRVFRELCLTVLTENETLRDKVRRLEGEEPQNLKPCTALKNHKVPKVRSAEFADLEMVSGSARSTCSDPVPTVFTHLALQQPIGSRHSCYAQELQETMDPGVPGSPEVEAEVVLGTTQIFTGPVTKDKPAKDPPGEDTAPHQEDMTVVSS
ncbi:hypothetical protein ATANTOWER_022269, partial [Ataeniobius toweri]|nr:hypothetical protein [Ataeniobius toweri]